MFPLSFTCLPHNLTFSAGSVKRARQRLRRCFGSNWGASEECWLAGLRCWPRPSDRPHTTEGLLGPGSGMTMCADLDPAPRPPTLTKDTTLALDCTICTANKFYSRVSSHYAICTSFVSDAKLCDLCGKMFSEILQHRKPCGCCGCRQRTQGSCQNHPWWLWSLN